MKKILATLLTMAIILSSFGNFALAVSNPLGLQASEDTPTSWTASWNTIEGATYNVDAAGVVLTNTTNTSVVMSGLSYNTEYTVKVEAIVPAVYEEVTAYQSDPRNSESNPVYKRDDWFIALEGSFVKVSSGLVYNISSKLNPSQTVNSGDNTLRYDYTGTFKREVSPEYKYNEELKFRTGTFRDLTVVIDGGGEAEVYYIDEIGERAADVYFDEDSETYKVLKDAAIEIDFIADTDYRLTSIESTLQNDNGIDLPNSRYFDHVYKNARTITATFTEVEYIYKAYIYEYEEGSVVGEGFNQHNEGMSDILLTDGSVLELNIRGLNKRVAADVEAQNPTSVTVTPNSGFYTKVYKLVPVEGEERELDENSISSQIPRILTDVAKAKVAEDDFEFSEYSFAYELVDTRFETSFDYVLVNDIMGIEIERNFFEFVPRPVTPDPTPAPEPTPVLYKLTVTSTDGGSVPGFEGTNSFSSGTNVNLNVLIEAGFEFKGWTGDVTASTQDLVVVMNSDKTLVANFGLPEVADEVIPEAEVTPEVVVEPILDEVTPEAVSDVLADATLPETGGIPASLISIFGFGLSSVGLAIKKRK